MSLVVATTLLLAPVQSIEMDPVFDSLRAFNQARSIAAISVAIDQENARERARRKAQRRAAERAAEEAEQAEALPVVVGVALCDWACIQCESGGDPQAWNPNGYWGLFQFDYQTWVAHGGNSATYGSAPAAEQYVVASRITYDAWSCN